MYNNKTRMRYKVEKIIGDWLSSENENLTLPSSQICDLFDIMLCSLDFEEWARVKYRHCVGGKYFEGEYELDWENGTSKEDAYKLYLKDNKA